MKELSHEMVILSPGTQLRCLPGNAWIGPGVRQKGMGGALGGNWSTHPPGDIPTLGLLSSHPTMTLWPVLPPCTKAYASPDCTLQKLLSLPAATTQVLITHTWDAARASSVAFLPPASPEPDSSLSLGTHSYRHQPHKHPALTGPPHGPS